MNIFYLSEDPKLCAQYHCDKHVVKMILEYAQLMCTAHHVTGSGTECMYKQTHKNHPCAVWVRSSVDNYMYVFELWSALLDEYKSRYGKYHKTGMLYDDLEVPPKLQGEWSDPPQCMPDEFKYPDTVLAYRIYYQFGKSHILSYKHHWPGWI